MTVEELITHLQRMDTPKATVIMSSGDYPASPSHVYKTSKYDGYITPGMGAKYRKEVVVLSGQVGY